LSKTFYQVLSAKKSVIASVFCQQPGSKVDSLIVAHILIDKLSLSHLVKNFSTPPDEVFVVEVRMPRIRKKGPKKLPVRLPDLGKELKELLKLPPCWSLSVGSKETGRDVVDSLRPLPDHRTLGSVLTERQLEDPRGRLYLAVSEGGFAKWTSYLGLTVCKKLAVTPRIQQP
jgi:hypothetical protein